MSEQDHRTYSIPLFSLGAILLVAGLVGLAVDAATDLATNNPAGVAATGAILVFASVAVAVLLNPLSSLGLAAARSVSSAGVFALVVILVAAIAGGSAIGAAEDADGFGAADVDGATGGAGSAAATAEGLLGTEDFAGSLSGAAAPGPLAMVGGAGSPRASHDLAVPDAARNLRVEVHWEPAATAGADTLEVVVQTADGEVVGSGSGGPGLAVDVEGVAAGVELVLVVSLPSGAPSAGQDYDAYVSYFESAIPAGFTAHEMA